MPSLIRAIGLLVCIIFVTSLVANQADAQVLRATTRTLGVFPGSGYHVKTPLTETRYYNPYSEHNTPRYVSPSDSSVMGLAPSGYWGSYGVEFGSYPGHSVVSDRVVSPRVFRWNAWSRGY